LRRDPAPRAALGDVNRVPESAAVNPTRSIAHVTRTLATCTESLAQLGDAPIPQLAALLAHLAALQQVVSARLLQDMLRRDESQTQASDRLLTVGEAARRLACSKDWLYRHRLPFAVRNGRQLRFSADGLERYIQQRAGRETASLPGRTER
jgi:excisionase family DNA binding protein